MSTHGQHQRVGRSLRHRARDLRDGSPGDRGESLLEIVITVVIVAVTITALVAGLGSVASAGNAHKLGVQADAVMRNYAEASKSAARLCTVGGTWTPDYTPPDGFAVSMEPADSACPGLADARRVELAVLAPDGTRHTMTIVVRTP
jgi:type II secretory pathway pseudopilin PulG